MVMAHRVRGAVHVPVPEEDQLEMERIFVEVMASAAMTHAHVMRGAAASGAAIPLPAVCGPEPDVGTCAVGSTAP